MEELILEVGMEVLDKMEVKRLIPDKTLIIVVDVQYDFISTEGFGAKTWNHEVFHLDKIVEKIKVFLEEMKSNNIDIIYTKTIYDPDKISIALKTKLKSFVGQYLAPNSKGIEFYKLNPPEEKIFVKYGFSAFTNKDLVEYIKNKEFENVMLVGFNTNLCVESTARDAVDFGLNTYIVQDLTGTPTFLQNHEKESLFTFNLIFGKVINSNQLKLVRLLEVKEDGMR